MESAKSKILLCSDNKLFVADFTSQLNKGFDTQVASSGDMSQFLVNEWEPHICLVDGNSPVFEVIPKLRQDNTYFQLGIIVLAKSSEEPIEEKAFHSGADHFIKLPCSFSSLNLRIQNIVNRMRTSHLPTSNILTVKAGNTNGAIINFGKIKIYPHDFLIKQGSEIITTTPTQFRLLLAFVTNREQLLSRSWIKEKVWDNSKISPRSIDAQISKLKKIIPGLEEQLMNIYGKGYILTSSKEEAA